MVNFDLIFIYILVYTRLICLLWGYWFLNMTGFVTSCLLDKNFPCFIIYLYLLRYVFTLLFRYSFTTGHTHEDKWSLSYLKEI